MQRLVRAYLQQLNDEVDGNEWKCVHMNAVFSNMPLRSFGEVVIPELIQELVHRGLVALCTNTEEVKITRQGKERVSKTVEANAFYILETLVSRTTNIKGVSADRLAALTELRPDEINDAVRILEESRFIELFGTGEGSPYMFDNIALTSRGRYEYEHRRSSLQNTTAPEQRIALPPTPIGSPYGFTEEDWETVSTRKRDSNKIYVVFGFQFKSTYYNSDTLCKNIESMFQKALHEYRKQDRSASDVEIDFKSLSAGYGGHLFNEIACDIISADIAVFEVSERNPNVMIELGVALTWGIRVLPIRHKNSPQHTPTDISGQTWAEYLDDGHMFDSNHDAKIMSMVERASRKKRRS
jgi:hypothetical protein